MKKCALIIAEFFFMVISVLVITLQGAAAQDRMKLDSLDLALNKVISDSERINLLTRISFEYMKFDHDEAIKYSQKAFIIAKLTNETNSLAVISSQMGEIYLRMGDYKASSFQFYSALKYFAAVEDTIGIVTCKINLGTIYDRIGQFDRALADFFEALMLTDNASIPKVKSDRLKSIIYNNIANAYQAKNDFDGAEQYYQRALSLAKNSDDLINQGTALSNLGELYMGDINQSTKALEYLLAGLSVRKETRDKFEIANSYLQLSTYYNQLGSSAQAKESGLIALNLATEIGSLEVLMYSYYCLSKIEESTGNFKESLNYHKLFKSLSDSIQSQMVGGELEKLKLQFDKENQQQSKIQKELETESEYLLVITVISLGLLVSIVITVMIRSRIRKAELNEKTLSRSVEEKNDELTSNIIFLVKKNELIGDVSDKLIKFKDYIPKEQQKTLTGIIQELKQGIEGETLNEFDLRFSKVHSDFYKKLRELYPDLSPAEEKLCAFLRLDMSSKEIAAITNLHVRSVDVARARLRKKLKLTNTTVNIVTHLTRI